jgi:hypothetical protein
MFDSKLIRSIPGYETKHGYATIEYVIWLMIQINPSPVPYVTFLILKCTTIRLGLSVGIRGTSNNGANPMECPSYRAIMAIARCFSQPAGINYGNVVYHLGVLMKEQNVCIPKMVTAVCGPMWRGVFLLSYYASSVGYVQQFAFWTLSPALVEKPLVLFSSELSNML